MLITSRKNRGYRLIPKARFEVAIESSESNFWHKKEEEEEGQMLFLALLGSVYRRFRRMTMAVVYVKALVEHDLKVKSIESVISVQVMYYVN